MAIYKLRQTTA